MLHTLRHVLAYLAACWVGGVGAYLLMIGASVAQEGTTWSAGDIVGIFLFCALMLLIVAPVLAPFTLLALFLINRFTRGGWGIYALAGALVAPCGAAAWIAMDDGWAAIPSAFLFGLPFAPAGAVAALTYRSIAPAPGLHETPA